MENKITKGTIIRTACLFLALINAALAMFGKSPLPIDDAMVEQTVSALFIFASSVVAWWKNNSFTKPARKADAILKEMKAEGK